MHWSLKKNSVLKKFCTVYSFSLFVHASYPLPEILSLFLGIPIDQIPLSLRLFPKYHLQLQEVFPDVCLLFPLSSIYALFIKPPFCAFLMVYNNQCCFYCCFLLLHIEFMYLHKKLQIVLFLFVPPVIPGTMPFTS